MMSEISYDVRQMHKEALRVSVLNSSVSTSLLGGQSMQELIWSGLYTPLSVCAYEGHHSSERRDGETLGDVISREFVPGSEGCRLLLYGGVGMGKTTAVEKIIWDWTNGTRLQQYTLLLRVPVLELAAPGGKSESLQSMLSRMHPHISIEDLTIALQTPQSLFLIIDGLQNFQCTPSCSSSLICDAQEEASGFTLLHSLLHKSLLPGASMLVTSKEPVRLESLRCFEVVGFSKTQQSTFFQQFFDDGDQAERLFCQTEQILGVYEQCFCPAFCWTVCNVLKTQSENKSTPAETLTHLLCIITHSLLQKHKMDVRQTREIVSKLTNPVCEVTSFLHHPVLRAFLRISGDVTSPDTTFSFLSPVMHEFLMAASFYLDQSVQILDECSDLYYIFLAGLSDSLQRSPLEESVGRFDDSRVSEFFQWLMGNISTWFQGFDVKKHYRVYRVLHHAQNSSLVKESLRKSQWHSVRCGSMQEDDCAALSYVVTCMGEMEHFNLYGAKLTDEQIRRLIPVLRLSKSINLNSSRLGLAAITLLSTALAEGRMTALNLSYTRLDNDSVKTLCKALKHTPLQTLSLYGCRLTPADCEALTEMLSGGSQLRVLGLYGNDLEDHGLIHLSSGLETSRLQELNLDFCSLTVASMSALSSALCNGVLELKLLNLGRNSVTDDGMELISQVIKRGHLKTLIVSDCELTGSCCSSLAAALQSENCCLTELNLSVNELGQSGAMQICDALKSPKCTLEHLEMTRCELTEEVFAALARILMSGLSRIISLSLGFNQVGDAGVKHMWEALRHKNCKLHYLDLEITPLTDACVEELCESVSASSSLSTLILKNNDMTDNSVPRLVQLMQGRPQMAELNVKYNDFSEDVFDLLETCPNIIY